MLRGALDFGGDQYWFFLGNRGKHVFYLGLHRDYIPVFPT